MFKVREKNTLVMNSEYFITVSRNQVHFVKGLMTMDEYLKFVGNGISPYKMGLLCGKRIYDYMESPGREPFVDKKTMIAIGNYSFHSGTIAGKPLKEIKDVACKYLNITPNAIHGGLFATTEHMGSSEDDVVIQSLNYKRDYLSYPDEVAQKMFDTFDNYNNNVIPGILKDHG